MLLDKMIVLGKNVSHASKSASSVTAFTNVLQLDAVKGFLINDASGNPISLSSKLNDMGKADGIMLNVMVGSTQLAASSAAANIDIRLHKKANGSSIQSGSIIYTVNVPSIKKAASIASHTKVGKMLVKIMVPRDLWGDTTKKYIGISTKALTAKILTGTLTAWLGGPTASQNV